MMRPCISILSLALVSSTGCHCSNADIVELDSDSASGTFGETSTGSATSSEGSTGEPFDASRWIGRYHFEHVFYPFGERGDYYSSQSLINFEILPDSRATMVYDHCNLEEAFTIEYEWRPDEDGWLSLYPGEGETSLRFMEDSEVETLRVRLIEPCRELDFDYDGMKVAFTVVRPGAACWIDKCTTGGTIMHVDYCEGEEPEEVCP